jgi:hypothetical protein
MGMPATRVKIREKASFVQRPAVFQIGSMCNLLQMRLSPYSERMEVHFTPDVEKKLNDLATQSGRGTDEVLQDALAVYFDELVQTRDVLNSRYDELKSGRVKAIDGEKVIARLREKSAARRSQPGS